RAGRQPDRSRLRVAGQRYAGLGGSAFALQDEGSLLSLLDPNPERWSTLLLQQGLTRQQAERFLDQLRDYTDQDDMRRVNGATSADYRRKGLPVPPGRLMISPGQLFNLLDADQLATTLRQILPLATTRSGE